MNQISVKGWQFAYEVMGTGPSTLVFEAGVGAESSEWGPVTARIARSQAVFRYDRAGREESDRKHGNRDAVTIVDELNALLDTPARQRLQLLWNELRPISHIFPIFEKSGHFVQRDDPDNIAMAVEALLRSRHA